MPHVTAIPDRVVASRSVPRKSPYGQFFYHAKNSATSDSFGGLIGHRVTWARTKTTVAIAAGCPTEGLLSFGLGHGWCIVFLGAATARRFDPPALPQASALQTQTCLRKPLQPIHLERYVRPYLSHHLSRRFTESDSQRQRVSAKSEMRCEVEDVRGGTQDESGDT